MAKTKLNRQQKAYLSQAQMNIWQQLATYEKSCKQYGEPYMLLQSIKQMMDLNIIDPKTASELADITFMMECLRIQKKIITKIKDKSEQYAKEQGIDIEELYDVNDLLTDGYCDDVNFVDTSRLIIGMVIKSYPALCELLGEEKTTGKANKCKWRIGNDILTMKNQNIKIALLSWTYMMNLYHRRKGKNIIKVNSQTRLKC